MKSILSVSMLALVAACAVQDANTATVYDDPNYPSENTAVVGPAPDNVGKVVITAVGGKPLQCGGWLNRSECQRVRLLPGMTIVRLDYANNTDGRLASARDMDLPINARGGHVYHIKATVVRDSSPGQGGARVVLQAIDKGPDRPPPAVNP